jgi:hypothetical protein
MARTATAYIAGLHYLYFCARLPRFHPEVYLFVGRYAAVQVPKSPATQPAAQDLVWPGASVAVTSARQVLPVKQGCGGRGPAHLDPDQLQCRLSGLGPDPAASSGYDGNAARSGLKTCAIMRPQEGRALVTDA